MRAAPINITLAVVYLGIVPGALGIEDIKALA